MLKSNPINNYLTMVSTTKQNNNKNSHVNFNNNDENSEVIVNFCNENKMYSCFNGANNTDTSCVNSTDIQKNNNNFPNSILLDSHFNGIIVKSTDSLTTEISGKNLSQQSQQQMKLHEEQRFQQKTQKENNNVVQILRQQQFCPIKRDNASPFSLSSTASLAVTKQQQQKKQFQTCSDYFKQKQPQHQPIHTSSSQALFPFTEPVKRKEKNEAENNIDILNIMNDHNNNNILCTSNVDNVICNKMPDFLSATCFNNNLIFDEVYNNQKASSYSQNPDFTECRNNDCNVFQQVSPQRQLQLSQHSQYQEQLYNSPQHRLLPSALPANLFCCNQPQQRTCQCGILLCNNNFCYEKIKNNNGRRSYRGDKSSGDFYGERNEVLMGRKKNSYRSRCTSDVEFTNDNTFIENNFFKKTKSYENNDENEGDARMKKQEVNVDKNDCGANKNADGKYDKNIAKNKILKYTDIKKNQKNKKVHSSEKKEGFGIENVLPSIKPDSSSSSPPPSSSSLSSSSSMTTKITQEDLKGFEKKKTFMNLLNGKNRNSKTKFQANSKLN